RTGQVLQLLEPLGPDAARVEGAHALEDAGQVEGLAGGAAAGLHGAAGHEDGGDVEPRGGHQHARRDLVAVGDADHAVEAVGRDHGLHAVGDQLSGGQGELHAVVAHGDAVVHPDGVELEGHAAGVAHRLLHHRPELLQVDVAGHDVHVGVDDGHEGLPHVRV